MKRRLRPRERLAIKARKKYTAAEKRMEQLLNEHPSLKFRDKFHREWILSSKWRLDFLLWETRIGIEVDGPYHSRPEQIIKDKKKTEECSKYGIILLRFSNEDVLCNGQAVMEKIIKEHDEVMRKVAIERVKHRLKGRNGSRRLK